MALWKAWARWCELRGEPERTQTWLGKHVYSREPERIKKCPLHPVMRVRGVYGIKLLVEEEFDTIEGSPPPQKTTKT